MRTLLPNRDVRPESNRHGLTIVELLVIVAVVAVLILLQLPALARASAQSRAAQCSSNLKQLALVTHIYAHENHDQVPVTSSGFWAWDMPGAVRDSFLRYGATRNSFYCPANPDQNVDGAWNYAGGAFSVAGYAFGYNGTISLSATNWNVLTIPQTIPFGPATYPPPSASKRVLLADVVMSTYGQNDSAQRNSYQYSGIVGGLGTTFSHRTSHLNNKFPAGGNVAMLDAHVEWRPFPLMLPRTDRTDMPCFWW